MTGTKLSPKTLRPARPLPWPKALHGLPPAVLRGFTPRRKVPVLIVGNSHTGALTQAIDPNKDPGILIVRVAGRDGTPYPRLRHPLLARYQPEVVVSLIAGNHHNAIGLIEPPEPYDFIVDDMPGTLPGRRIVPLGEIEAAIEAHMAPHMVRLDRLLGAFPGKPAFHVAGPPPIGDEGHIKTYPGNYAPASGLNPQITPKSVRMKLYLVQNRLLAAHCAARGITFVAAPEAGCDAEGFLAADCRKEDPTHGNAHYGRLVLETIKHAVANRGAAAPVAAEPAAAPATARAA